MSTALKRYASALALLLAITFTLAGLTSPIASAQSAADESAMFNATNQSRADNGKPAIQYDAALSKVANAWANQLAAARTLSHNPSLVDQVNNQVTTQWTRLGENVGFGPDVARLEQAFMNSAPHQANILGDYNLAGVGAARDGNGTLWVVVNFMKAPVINTAAPPGAVHPMSWFLRNSTSAGPPDAAFSYGISGYKFVSGDWDGDGTDSVGVFSNGSWYLRNSTTSGSPDVSFAYGAPGYVPVIGDWDGDGDDTIGVYFNGWFYLRNSNTPGSPDIVVNYGAPGYTPVVGDWNADGTDTIGVYVSGWWYLRDAVSGGSPSSVINYGAAGYAPVVGQWSQGGPSGIGVIIPA